MIATERKIVRRTIIERLDAIERMRKSRLGARYRHDYPELSESEIERLGDLVASTRIRLIAEIALSHLPSEVLEQVLGRFEN